MCVGCYVYLWFWEDQVQSRKKKVNFGLCLVFWLFLTMMALGFIALLTFWIYSRNQLNSTKTKLCSNIVLWNQSFFKHFCLRKSNNSQSLDIRSFTVLSTKVGQDSREVYRPFSLLTLALVEGFMSPSLLLRGKQCCYRSTPSCAAVLLFSQSHTHSGGPATVRRPYKQSSLCSSWTWDDRPGK